VRRPAAPAQGEFRRAVADGNGPNAFGNDLRNRILRARIERLVEHHVGDIVAEGFETKLSRLERDVRGAHEAARGIDDVDGLQRRGVRRKRLPNVQALEEIDGACQQGRRARFRTCGFRFRRRPDQRDLGPHMRECERRGGACGTGADHGNIEMHHCVRLAQA
jgi:hypothetical protein